MEWIGGLLAKKNTAALIQWYPQSSMELQPSCESLQLTVTTYIGRHSSVKLLKKWSKKKCGRISQNTLPIINIIQPTSLGTQQHPSFHGLLSGTGTAHLPSLRSIMQLWLAVPVQPAAHVYAGALANKHIRIHPQKLAWRWKTKQPFEIIWRCFSY